MRVVFIIQGEGRGHLTQAISLSQILRRAGHRVAAVLVGQAEGREIPAFFSEQIHAPIHPFLSPNLIYDNNRGSIDIGRTIRTHLLRSKKYTASLRIIHTCVQESQPDLILNFYEVLGGLYKITHRNAAPMVCVAHQYLLLHPQFPFPKNSWLDRQIVNFNTRLTALGASRKLALSFRRFPETETAHGLTIVPPLLRREIRELQPVTQDFALVYMTHPCLSRQIIDWHEKYPGLPLHCFWDNPEAPEVLRVDDTLTFHRLNGPKYLHMMETCRALVTTAGFESVCEAMYLGKPVLMVPVPKHFEQACNAIDGVLSGAGASARTFDLSVLTDFLPYFQSPQQEFKTWCHETDWLFVKHLEAVVNEAEQKISAPMGELAFS
ncbi:glycosyltransferase family protein [Persicitalea jodogahamensis]|uniref:Glycosyl transferase n=1 Tax=Persicitalea jodogahamensis TaxID=402147 RepID=A0A8J3DCC9_9BACT|nr:glycosyltransferase family protein [Persicitalea jodogahamensis]GHB83198.1 glycosyl transferase [Persicitalea jodogahamensis]